MTESSATTEARFLELLRRALLGWQLKADTDFSEASAEAELLALHSDPVYEQFALATPEYVLVRLMGRMSISIGRRLGELYDNLPKYVAAARFGLQPADVAAKINRLNLDVQIPLGMLEADDAAFVKEVVSKSLKNKLPEDSAGLGIEIRYNFNPNDSARLRKDEAMAQGLMEHGLAPVYLVFSSISPRNEAIERLSRAGWEFLVGEPASDFTHALLGLDLKTLLSKESVQTEIKQAMTDVMSTIMTSPAMAAASAKH